MVSQSKLQIQFTENKHNQSFHMRSDHERNRWVGLAAVYTYTLMHVFAV